MVVICASTTTQHPSKKSTQTHKYIYDRSALIVVMKMIEKKTERNILFKNE
jgi:hypothetical protein